MSLNHIKLGCVVVTFVKSFPNVISLKVQPWV